MLYFMSRFIYFLEFLQILKMDTIKFQRFTYIQHTNQEGHPVPLPLFDLILHISRLGFKRHESGNFYISTKTKAKNSLSPQISFLPCEHPDHQEIRLILQLTFCFSCIKMLSFLDCSPFVLFLEFLYNLSAFLFTPDLPHLEVFPVLTPTIFCLFFLLLLLPLIYEMNAKVFISPSILRCDKFSCPFVNVFKAFPVFLQVTNCLKYCFQF